MTETGERRPAPNVIVIVADDLGYGDLGCYGNGEVCTPHLDRLAAEGVRLTQHYSASPMCAPARASLLTGKYPHRVGTTDVCSCRGLERIAPDERLLPEDFRAAGYRTGLVGKWHNGRDDRRYHPLSRGFDEFVGFCIGGMDYWDWTLEDNGKVRPADGRYLTDVLTEEALGFIGRHRAQPFFLYLAYNAPHTPLQAPEAEIEPFRRTGRFTEAVSTIYAMIHRMDSGIGRILEALRDYDLEDDTLVLVVSDNGPDMKGEGERSARRFNGIFSGMKGNVLEGGIRVPGIVRWPSRLWGGQTCAAPIHFNDWLPTLLDCAGIGLNERRRGALDGRSVLQLLTSASDTGAGSGGWARADGASHGLNNDTTGHDAQTVGIGDAYRGADQSENASASTSASASAPADLATRAGPSSDSAGEAEDAADAVGAAAALRQLWQWNRYEPVARCNAALREGDWKLVYPAIAEAMRYEPSDTPVTQAMQRNPTLTYELVREPVRRTYPAPAPPRLYNLAADPGEREDVSAQHPERTARMARELDAWFAELAEQSRLRQRETLGLGQR
ncbi:sulfatase-like hydrolase/transferase [Paenibacillus sabuli]|nr:sulfatase-like hydrolase/transferase [Paenibacillus sabuli]